MLLKRLLCLLLVCAASFVTGAEKSSAPVLTLQQYQSELDQLIVSADTLDQNPGDISAVINSLPPAWNVHTSDASFRVSTEPLKNALQQLKEKKKKAEALQELQLYLRTMRDNAQAYSTTEHNFQKERETVSTILASPEFRSVSGPSWQDRLKYRMLKWLASIVERVFGSSAFPLVSKIVVWVLVGLALLMLAITAYRMIRRRTAFETIMPEPLPVSAKEWGIWMAEARAAAEQGRWRDAIHLSYWAGISFLEAQGMWRPDRARTPREYLRLLSPSSEYRPALKDLTRRFEVIWYGYEPADAAAYSQTVAELEKLGCR